MKPKTVVAPEDDKFAKLNQGLENLEREVIKFYRRRRIVNIACFLTGSLFFFCSGIDFIDALLAENWLVAALNLGVFFVWGVLFPYFYYNTDV